MCQHEFKILIENSQPQKTKVQKESRQIFHKNDAESGGSLMMKLNQYSICQK